MFKIKGFAHFVKIIESTHRDSELVLFRGQSTQGNLLPGISRENPEIDRPERERKMLKDLRSMGESLLHRHDSIRAGRFVALDKNPKIRKAVVEIQVPENLRKPLLVSLDRHGVSSRTMFPDLEGLCTFINWRNEVKQ